MYESVQNSHAMGSVSQLSNRKTRLQNLSYIGLMFILPFNFSALFAIRC